jgi:predicted alpha/beta-hydrolase family hydrolase
MADAAPVTIEIDDTRRVSGLFLNPKGARACYVFAHSAGAGMTHASMQVFADGLYERRIASLRYQFPFMEAKSGRPDSPKVAHAAVRAAVAKAAALTKAPLVAGGRSFGGRMTSQAQALEPLPRVVGLAFLGFPLHPAGRPSDDRAAHLSDVSIPMLFLTGDRDDLGDLSLLRPVVKTLGKRASLHVLAHADHSFHVLKRSSRTNAEVNDEALTTFEEWLTPLL